ncbi:uncharacterized protein LOC123303563 [Chrysoperla carnea]|uniref:uncharacterized protein LOC123303563 n=1 Tax=Chrysoperla carnea TaxID=189513 RepID=UPI001D08A988|nr:uncharacterized protein LOC123303563 [Chrysoperla carnea]
MIGDTVVLKRVLIPCIGLMKVKCEAASEDPKSPLKCRPSELPFYCDEKKKSTTHIQDDIDLIESSEFEKKTSQIRKELFNTVDIVSNYVNSISDKVNVDQVKEWTSYLQEEENVAPRAGAIALGGLTGLIFGLRGGMFRKAFYTTAGTLTMTAVCYPKTTAEYSHLVIDDTRRYLTIAYNFVYGVKPGDPQKELPSLPTIPTSLSEAWSLTSSIGRSAKTLILGESKESSSDSSSKKETK